MHVPCWFCFFLLSFNIVHIFFHEFFDGVVSLVLFILFQYWIPLDNISVLQTLVVRHLPLYEFKTGVSPWISSVYLDDPTEFPMYHQRIQRKHDARTFRIRWWDQICLTARSLFFHLGLFLSCWTFVLIGSRCLTSASFSFFRSVIILLFALCISLSCSLPSASFASWLLVSFMSFFSGMAIMQLQVCLLSARFTKMVRWAVKLLWSIGWKLTLIS